MTVSLDRLLSHHHALLLQGKMGSFFSCLADFLLSQGLSVTKVNFNAGDALFYKHKGDYLYRGQLEGFGDWLLGLLALCGADVVVCFGDARPHHVVARKVCEQLGISFFVFEEGYFRPDYITLQEHGVNGNSRLDFSKVGMPLGKTDINLTVHDCPMPTNNRFYYLCVVAILYDIVVFLFKDEFPFYQHYRGLSVWQEGGAWAKAFFRKLVRYFPDKWLQYQLVSQFDGLYFLVSLQVYNDTQITHHSDYVDVVDFIEDVIASFASHASAEHYLLFKHHPLDRGYRNYRKLINRLAQHYGISGRVFYGCDLHLPTIIKHSLGMVTVNSTTGLQSIYHKKPVKVMGVAIYDMLGLTDQKPLSMFWQNPTAPDYEFYIRFREYLINQTQLNGSFYGKSPWMDQFANG